MWKTGEEDFYDKISTITEIIATTVDYRCEEFERWTNSILYVA